MSAAPGRDAVDTVRPMPDASPAFLSLDLAAHPAPGGALEIGPDWAGFVGAHGGLLMAAAANAMGAVAPEGRALRSIHVDFQGAVQQGTLQLDARVDRSGRSVTFASVGGTQGGRDRLSASAVFGDSAEGISYAPVDQDAMPTVAGPLSRDAMPTRGTPALQTIEYRPARDPLPFAGAEKAEFHVWVAVLGDPAPIDLTRALVLLDAPAPGLYATLTQPVPIPTIEFTAHVLPALAHNTSRFALARMRTLVATDGYCIDDCELWGEDGALLATSRQLRRVMA